MNPDGTIYHRYGTRDARSASSFLSMKSFARVLKAGLQTHTEYQKHPTPPKITKRTLDDFPVWAKKVKQKRVDCYHCHFVFETENRQASAEGTFKRAQIWRWPGPERIGLSLDREEQERVLRVERGSPAARAGLRKGDRLERLGKQRILSHADLSAALEDTPAAGATLTLSYRRAAKTRRATLRLKAGWREGTPWEFSWRPSKWWLRPRPGFGGGALSKAEKRKLRLPPKGLAFKVSYVVTWGKEPRYGKNAQRAGIRKGDVVYAIGGKTTRLKSVDHFHAWWRLTRKPGQRVSLKVLRRGKTLRVQIPVIE